jgi:hypothetical protein
MIASCRDVMEDIGQEAVDQFDNFATKLQDEENFYLKATEALN